MNEPALSDAGSGLIDIIEPVAPSLAETAGWLWPVVTIVLLLLLAVSLFLLWKLKWPGWRAASRVKKLQQQVLSGAVSAQDGLYLLAQELRAGLGMATMLAEEAPARFVSSDRDHWPVFLRHLDEMRYQPVQALSYASLTPHFIQVEAWLRRYAR